MKMIIVNNYIDIIFFSHYTVKYTKYIAKNKVKNPPLPPKKKKE